MSRTKFVRMARINGGKSEGSHTMTAGPNKALTNWARISMGCPTAVGKDTTKSNRAKSQRIHNRWWKRHRLVHEYNCSIRDIRDGTLVKRIRQFSQGQYKFAFQPGGPPTPWTSSQIKPCGFGICLSLWSFVLLSTHGITLTSLRLRKKYSVKDIAAGDYLWCVT